MRLPPTKVRGRVGALTLALESSLASPEAAARWADEQRGRSGALRRAVMTTLIEKAVAHPEITGRVIRRTLPDDLEYRGVGYHSVVWSSDGTVLKVNRHSIHVTEQRRTQILATERAVHDIVDRYLGDPSVPQQIFIGPHPASPRLRAVIISQSFRT